MEQDASHTGNTLRELAEALCRDDTWPHVETLVRRTVRVVVDEWQKASQTGPGLKIDIKALVHDLGGKPLNAELHRFFTWNHRWVATLAERNRRAAVAAHDFADAQMPGALFNPKQMAVVESKRDAIMALGGHILDLGVHTGWSTRSLAAIFPNQTIHGFDSFEGLPEDWMHMLKGAFGDVGGALPNMPGNVRLYKGWFDDTLPVWFDGHKDTPISLLRVDCDLYSSTKTIFRVLHPLIKSGTWILFDELFGYHGWEDHEYKAFNEFKAETGIAFEYVAFGLTYAMGYVK